MSSIASVMAARVASLKCCASFYVEAIGDTRAELVLASDGCVIWRSSLGPRTAYRRILGYHQHRQEQAYKDSGQASLVVTKILLLNTSTKRFRSEGVAVKTTTVSATTRHVDLCNPSTQTVWHSGQH